MDNIKSLVLHFFYIMIFKKKPQDLKYSINLFIILFCCTLVLSNQIVYYLEIGIFSNIFFSILISNFSFLIIIYFFLKKISLSKRFIQTASNLLGVEIINLILFVTVVFFNNNLNKYYIHFFISLCISIWLFFVRVHIIKNSFNYNILKSVFFCFIFLVLNFLLTCIISFFMSPIFKYIN